MYCKTTIAWALETSEDADGGQRWRTKHQETKARTALSIPDAAFRLDVVLNPACNARCGSDVGKIIACQRIKLAPAGNRS